MPFPIPLIVAGAFAAGAGIYGGVQALIDDDPEASGTDRAAGAPQPGATDPANQDVAGIFQNQNEGGVTAQEAQRQAQSGFTPGSNITDEVNGIVGGGVSLDQLAGGSGFVDQEGEQVAITDPGVPSPFEGLTSPGQLDADDQRLLELLTGVDWSGGGRRVDRPGGPTLPNEDAPANAFSNMSPDEQAQWLQQVQAREFPMEAVANTLFALEDRPDELLTLQQKLFATGYYGALEYDDVRWGVVGPETIDAFSGPGKLLSFASRYRTPDGEKLSWQTLLDRLVEAEGGLRASLEEATEESQPQVVVSLQDPQALVETLDAVWQRNTGRKAPNEAKRRFVAVMHGLQRNAQATQQIAAQTPGDGTVTEVVQPSAEGQAEALVDVEAPDESLAFQSLQAYQGLLQKIGG